VSAVAEILPIEAHHLAAVARLHQRAFGRSALSRLGAEAVRRYYEWQLNGPHQHHFIGAFEGPTLRGYAVGGRSHGALSGFLRRNRSFLAWRAFLHPSLLFTEHGRGACRSALRLLTHRVVRPSPGPKPSEIQKSFGVLAIAVDPDCQGKGLGQQLMQAMDRAAIAGGYSQMHLTVHPKNTQAVRFYERLCWSRTLDGATWNGRMEKAFGR